MSLIIGPFDSLSQIASGRNIGLDEEAYEGWNCGRKECGLGK